jgi:hypothetical protein
MSEFTIVVRKNVAIPKRDMHFAPRSPKYNFASLVQGDSFVLTVEGKNGQKKQDGTPLTVAEDAARKARQKQSAIAMTAKRQKIKVVTRFYPLGEPTNADGSGSGKPELVVWHAGARTAADDAEAPAEVDPDGIEIDA